MKLFSILFSLSAIWFLPQHCLASAEIERADRVRSGYMEVIFASGVYAETRNAVIALNFNEGSTGPASMSFTVQGHEFLAKIWNILPSSCGDRFYARINIAGHSDTTDLELIDYSQVRCRLFAREKWHATVVKREPDGTESKLVLVGNPAIDFEGN